jgi:hypothetical protein
MNMAIDCWKEIRNLNERKLETLDRRKPFQITYVANQKV